MIIADIWKDTPLIEDGYKEQLCSGTRAVVQPMLADDIMGSLSDLIYEAVDAKR